jgi:hypothetical protein
MVAALLPLIVISGALAQQPPRDELAAAVAVCEQHKVRSPAAAVAPHSADRPVMARQFPPGADLGFEPGFENCARVRDALKTLDDAAHSAADKARVDAITGRLQ